MKLYIKIYLIASIIMLGAIGGYSLLFSDMKEEAKPANAFVEESELRVIIENENRKYIALACDSVCPNAPYLCKVAFCSVILNRCDSQAFPNTAAEVISEDPVFMNAWYSNYDNEPSDVALRAYDDALSGFSPCPDALYFSTSETTDITLIKRQTLFKIGKYIFS